MQPEQDESNFRTMQRWFRVYPRRAFSRVRDDNAFIVTVRSGSTMKIPLHLTARPIDVVKELGCPSSAVRGSCSRPHGDREASQLAVSPAAGLIGANRVSSFHHFNHATNDRGFPEKPHASSKQKVGDRCNFEYHRCDGRQSLGPQHHITAGSGRQCYTGRKLYARPPVVASIYRVTAYLVELSARPAAPILPVYCVPRNIFTRTHSTRPEPRLSPMRDTPLHKPGRFAQACLHPLA
ncbi:hypothetical protein B0T16DRAFT_125820 [Cercophora newfieldiana]|uniref:Uncharacterized protein n=1 Tax=Cercophora newfieldiana TaxID=92897 RepID=A0AA39YDP0_9PEZI|nr:hypothetical protein B0T16DRAFT_125820 [Cercophora newfieldiana]